MRETDGEPSRARASIVDTREGARPRPATSSRPRRKASFAWRTIEGDLFDLCRGEIKGRAIADEITLFKSCGTAIEDLAAADDGLFAKLS